MVVFLLLLAAASVFLLRILCYKTGFRYRINKWWRFLEDSFHVHQIFKVPEFNDSVQENLLYRKVSVYLNALPSLEDADSTNLFTGRKHNDVILRLDPSQTVNDYFLGARISWINDHNSAARTFVLKIRKADKRRILLPYLQHIHAVSDEIDQKKRELKLHMNLDDSSNRGPRRSRWRSVPFRHPSNFDTIAMEADLKSKVKFDLESFVKSKQYYHRLGRVWKRSFLLYGPSGTGKSSFVAAMANFLSYDVYNIDLTGISNDTDLQILLLETNSKSVIVIEDLDRFLSAKSALSLSGILSFMDGIVSSCSAEERLMVFTMNSKEHLDPAILRPGRIDVHIHFPLCDFNSFKSLANNCLGLTEHRLFPQVEEIIQGGARLSAAEIEELMISNRSSPNRALKSVITAMRADGNRGSSSSGIGQRLHDEASSPESRSGVFGKDGHAMKDIRKLYGFLRMKSSRKMEVAVDSGTLVEGKISVTKANLVIKTKKKKTFTSAPPAAAASFLRRSTLLPSSFIAAMC